MKHVYSSEGEKVDEKCNEKELTKSIINGLCFKCEPSCDS